MQADLARIRTRDALVRNRTALINHVRGSVKAFGARIPASCLTTCKSVSCWSGAGCHAGVGALLGS